MTRYSQFRLFVILAFFLTGCGYTKQYMIPRSNEGKLLVKPKWKLRASLCASCYMWDGDTVTPEWFVTIINSPQFKVDYLSPRRERSWILFFPVESWRDRRPISVFEQVELGHLIALKITNNSGVSKLIASNPILLIRAGKELRKIDFRKDKDTLAPGESALLTLNLGGWENIGWEYSLDLSGPLGEGQPQIPFERFTSTTYGLVILD